MGRAGPRPKFSVMEMQNLKAEGFALPRPWQPALRRYLHTPYGLRRKAAGGNLKQIRKMGWFSILLFAASLARAQAAPEQKAAVVEHGKFTLHKFEQPIGEETYEITRDGESLVTKIDFKFVDRGSPVPLSVTFRGAPTLTPQAFEIKGNTSRFSKIDQAVEVQRRQSSPPQPRAMDGGRRAR